MKVILDIDDDVLQVAVEITHRERTTIGQVISALARQGLPYSHGTRKQFTRVRGGVPLLPSRGEVVTYEHVLDLMDRSSV